MEKKLENGFLGMKMESFKSSKGGYIDGKQNGKWIVWYRNENKSKEHEYIDGN